jgi:hypothetical protein
MPDIGEKCIQNLIRLHEGPRYRWENNIKMDLKDMYARVWAGFISLRPENSSSML